MAKTQATMKPSEGFRQEARLQRALGAYDLADKWDRQADMEAEYEASQEKGN